jgi:two-component system, chemotaxis family, protein-glutamate methylesterase/glutaminase
MRGGVAIVQDPKDADFAEMPQSALEQVDDIDYVIPLSAIPAVIVQVVQQLVSVSEYGNGKKVEVMVEETRPDTLICPECGGALKVHEEGRLLQYHCHVGHVFGLGSLHIAYGQKIEETLWAALRALQEQNMLLRQMSARTSNARQREEYQKQAEAGEQHASNVRLLLQHLGNATTPGVLA